MRNIIHKGPKRKLICLEVEVINLLSQIQGPNNKSSTQQSTTILISNNHSNVSTTTGPLKEESREKTGEWTGIVTR